MGSVQGGRAPGDTVALFTVGHGTLTADDADAALLVHGAEVRHLLHDGQLAPHQTTDAARRAGDVVVYDEPAQGRLLDVDETERDPWR